MTVMQKLFFKLYCCSFCHYILAETYSLTYFRYINSSIKFKKKSKKFINTVVLVMLNEGIKYSSNSNPADNQNL